MEKKNRKVTKKDKANSILATIVAIVIVSIFALYLGNSVYTWWQKPTNVFLVENGEISLSESTVGYVIRDEQVIPGQTNKNGILQIKTDGQKVANGDTVLRYYSGEEKSIQNEIANIDVQIQEMLENNNNASSSDVKKALEMLAKSELDELYKNNELQKMKEFKQEISTIIAKKAKIIGNLSTDNEALSNLIKQREELEKELNKKSIDLKAIESGIVSYRVDRLEEKLQTDDFSYLNKNFLEQLTLKTGQIIATNEEKVKIINNFEGYIAVILTSNQAKDARIGDKVNLILSNMKEISATISYINVEEDDSRTIVFKITKGIEELIKYRKISLDIEWWSYEGWRIPNSSILTEEGKTYIVRNRAGYLDKILVKTLRQNEDYSIVTRYSAEELKEMGYTAKEINNMPKVSLYDEILINPNN